MEQAVRERRRLYGGMELPIECYSIRMSYTGGGQTRTPHYHEHIEFLYASGRCDLDVWIDGDHVPFRTGDLLIISSNAAHVFKSNLPHGEHNTYICIKAMPDIFVYGENSFFDKKYVMSFFGGDGSAYRHFSACETEGTDIPHAFGQAIKEWVNKDYGYEISLKSHLYVIFLWAVRRLYSNGDLIHRRSVGGSVENIRLIQRATEYVNENFATADESETAAHINLSYSHFSRLFRRVMDKSFKDYLMETRIDAAERMLLDSEASVTEVALSCGFATSSHFIERFKMMKGMTPKQYRRMWTEK
jgi:AraC-like DNA-binding protein/mannose-6-phosphate isomerase-like protein (cupin superfamily)